MDHLSAIFRPAAPAGLPALQNIDASSASLPPLRRPLPYTKADYEALPPGRKSSALDFLILGKVPPRPVSSAPGRAGPGALTVSQCIERGEVDALKFLWERWGVDPNGEVCGARISQLDLTIAQALIELCDAYPGLQLSLAVSDVDACAATALSTLITQGKVRNLSLGPDFGDPPIEAAALARLAPMLGYVTHSLRLECVSLEADSESALSQALANSSRLKVLELRNVEFKSSCGAWFVDAMKSNRSIVDLTVCKTSMPGSHSSGYPAIFAQNTTIENLEIYYDLVPGFNNVTDMASLLSGMVGNHSLRSLTIRNASPFAALQDLSCLQHLLEKNSTLTTLCVSVTLSSREAYLAVADSLRKNTALTTFNLDIPDFKVRDVWLSFEETLARNRQLLNTEKMRAAGMAFDPDNRKDFSDVGMHLAKHILANSATRAEFAETMAAVELSVRELDRQAALSASTTTAAPTVTTQTAGASATTTTTTTTTFPATQSPSAGSAAS